MEAKLIRLLLAKEIDEEACVELLHDKFFSYEKFISLLFRNKIAAYVTKELLESKIIYEIHPKWSQVLISYIYGNQKRNEIIYEYIRIIIEEFNRNNVRYVVLNGTDYILSVYQDFECRFMKDIDILVDYSQLSKVENICITNGYKQVEHHYQGLQEVTREEKIFKLCAHNVLSPYVYETGKFVCPFINVEIAFDIFPRFKNRTFNNLNEHALQKINSIEYKGTRFNVLNNEMKLIQMSIHIYNDSVKLANVINGKCDELIKYLDMYLLIDRCKIDWDYIIEISREHEICDIVYFALYHLSLLFVDSVDKKIMSEIQPVDLSYLNYFGAEDDNCFKWKTDFLERIFMDKRMEEAYEAINNANGYNRYIKMIGEVKNETKK